MYAVHVQVQGQVGNQPLEGANLDRLVESVRFAMVPGDEPGAVAESMLKNWGAEDYMSYWVELTAKGFGVKVAELPSDGELSTPDLTKAVLAQYVAQALAEEPLAS